jgi:hypothetical protein
MKIGTPYLASADKDSVESTAVNVPKGGGDSTGAKRGRGPSDFKKG